MSTGTISPDVEGYLHAVRARLDDLPAEEREDLLADVEPSIVDSAEDSDAPVALRLGPPDRFADDLRAAAGLPPRAGLTAPPAPSLRDRIARLRSDPRAQRLRELAPLWWALRAVVVLGFVGMVDGSSQADGYLPGPASIPILVVAVALSVAVGMRGWRHPALTVVNAVLIVATVPVLWNIADRVQAANASASYYFQPENGISYDGTKVRNLFAFDREGRLLQDVRLYTADGQPLEIGTGPDRNRRVARTEAGTRALNAFPIRYFEPGTRRVADPAAGAPDPPAPLAGEPLRDR